MPMSRTTCWSGLSPTLADAPLYPYKYYPGSGYVDAAAGSPPRVHGGYNALCVANGVDPFGGTPVTNESSSLQMPLIGGQFRLVAAGFEVVNTSPELYKGGTVTCWRTPFQRSTTNGFVLGSSRSIMVNMANWIPTTQAGAQLYPNSRTWGAADGVYSVATNSDTENPFVTLVPNTPFVTDQPSAGGLVALSQAGTGQIAYSHFNTIVSPDGIGNLAQNLSFDYHGAIFTGLDPNANLQVTVKYMIERIPTIAEPDLLVLSRAPTGFDPTALEIYSRCMQNLPVGVPVGENPLGEWFSDVLSIVGEWAPKLGNFIGGPASMIGTAVGGAANAALATRQNKPPPKPKRQKQPHVMQKPPANAEVAELEKLTRTIDNLQKRMNSNPRKRRRPRKLKQAQ